MEPDSTSPADGDDLDFWKIGGVILLVLFVFRGPVWSWVQSVGDETSVSDSQLQDDDSREARAKMTVDGVTVSAKDGDKCFLVGAVDAVNDSGRPVEVWLEVGIYRGDQLMEVDDGYWDLMTDFEGALTGLTWPESLFSEPNLACRVHKLEVTPRG